MNTFPEATRGTVSRVRIIARGSWLAILMMSLALLLSSCSALRLAYNQAPSLAYWWIDGYADLNEAQTSQLRSDIDGFFAWHRGSEVPEYIARMRQWQQMAQSPSSPDQACAQFDVVKNSYLRMVDRSLEPMARLALTLTPAQLRHLQQKYAKNNREFEKKYIRVSEEERLDNLMERALDRYEPIYGDLSAAQLELLRNLVRNSPFDAQRVNTERLRRQTDLLQTLRGLQSDRNTSLPAATQALRRWHERVMQSPLPGFAEYSNTLIRSGCEQFAAVHNTTTPEQRAHAVRVLKDYESDLRSLVSAP
jgi:Family of unknown function (DUF6279)